MSPWIRLDDREPEEWVASGLSPVACWARVELLGYANRNLTDGLVRTSVARRVVSADEPTAVLAELVEAGVLDAVSGGFCIVGYHDKQPSREQVERQREQTRERQERFRTNRDAKIAKREAAHRDGDHSHCFPDAPCRRNAVTDAVTNGSPYPSPTRPEPGPTPREDRAQGRGGNGLARPSAGATGRTPPPPPAREELTDNELDPMPKETDGPPAEFARYLRGIT